MLVEEVSGFLIVLIVYSECIGAASVANWFAGRRPVYELVRIGKES